MNSFEARFHANLHARIDAAVNDKAAHLANGAARRPDGNATAAEYLHIVGYIQALRDVRDVMCTEIADEMSGKEGGKSA